MFSMYFSTFRPMLGGFITPASCMKLNSESGIIYALAITSLFGICRTKVRGEAVVLVSNPSRGPRPLVLCCPTFSFLFLSFFFFCFLTFSFLRFTFLFLCYPPFSFLHLPLLPVVSYFFFLASSLSVLSVRFCMLAFAWFDRGQQH